MRKTRLPFRIPDLSDFPDFPATRSSYIRMTGAMRELTYGLPGGAGFLRVPTYLCAALYILSLLMMFVRGDARIVRALLVPAACFLVVTVLRPLIGRERPYDHFDSPPVGGYKRGKGRSMPSRHTASAAAVACAVIYAFPSWPVAVLMVALSLLIASLRLLAGQHYLSDVLAAVAISFILSLIGYVI